MTENKKGGKTIYAAKNKNKTMFIKKGSGLSFPVLSKRLTPKS
jgi:hypothetical protein